MPDTTTKTMSLPKPYEQITHNVVGTISAYRAYNARFYVDNRDKLEKLTQLGIKEYKLARKLREELREIGEKYRLTESENNTRTRSLALDLKSLIGVLQRKSNLAKKPASGYTIGFRAMVGRYYEPHTDLWQEGEGFVVWAPEDVGERLQETLKRIASKYTQDSITLTTKGKYFTSICTSPDAIRRVVKPKLNLGDVITNLKGMSWTDSTTEPINMASKSTELIEQEIATFFSKLFGKSFVWSAWGVDDSVIRVDSIIEEYLKIDKVFGGVEPKTRVLLKMALKGEQIRLRQLLGKLEYIPRAITMTKQTKEQIIIQLAVQTGEIDLDTLNSWASALDAAAKHWIQEGSEL